MKKVLPILFCICTLKFASAQITVTINDFAMAGESVLTSFSFTPDTLNYHQSGAGATWDFSSLQADSQSFVAFLDPGSTNLTYSAAFGYLLSSNPANVALNASDVSLNLDLTTVTFSSVIDFYDVSPTDYTQVGWGGTTNGLAVPTIFSKLDTVYRFPVNYGNADTCVSGFVLQFPSVAYLSEQQVRIDSVDGWGQITTPFGTFQALRMVTDLYATDSLFVDTLNFPIVTKTHTRQYKWIANNQGEPVLEVNTQFQNGPESISSIAYPDSNRYLTGIAAINPNDISFEIYPNPANSQFVINLHGNLESCMVTITDVTGKTILESPLTENKQSLDVSNLAKGLYFVTVNSNSQKQTKKLVLN